MAGLLPRIVGADDVDLGGGGAPLHHVHDVVRVGDVEAGGESFSLLWKFREVSGLGKFLHWVGGVPVKVGQSRDPPPLRADEKEIF